MSDIPLLLIQRVCLERKPPLQMCLSSCWIGQPNSWATPTKKYVVFLRNLNMAQNVYKWLTQSQDCKQWQFQPEETWDIGFCCKGEIEIVHKMGWKEELLKTPGLGKHFENMSNTCSPKLVWQKPHFFNRTRFLLQHQTAQRLCGTCSAAHPILCGRCTRFGFLKGCRVTRCMLKKYYSYIKW